MNFFKKIIILIYIGFFYSNYLISQDFEVKPMKLYFDCSPENSQTKNIKVKSYSSDTITYVITSSDFNRDSLGKTFFFEKSDFKYSLNPYINLHNSFFSITPYDSINIPITLTIPDSIKSSLWSVIYIKSVNEQKVKLTDNENKANITISPQIAVKLIYNYPETKKDSLSTHNIKVFFNEKTNTDNALIEIINNGKIIFNGNVNLLFSNIKIPDSEHSFNEKIELMPNSKRIVTFDLKSKLNKGNYAFSTITNNNEGKYVSGKQDLIIIK